MTVLRTCTFLGIIAILLLQTGCWGWVRASAGPVTSTTLRAGRQGGELAVDMAIGGVRARIEDEKGRPVAANDRWSLDEAFPFAIYAGYRGRVARDTGDVSAMAGVLYIRRDWRPVSLYAIGAMNLFQIGSTDGAFSFGMLGPTAELGLVYEPPRDNVFLFTFGARAQYDIRFTHQPNEGFIALSFGAALGGRPSAR